MGSSARKTVIVATLLAIITFLAVDAFVGHVLAGARDALCAEGSLKQEHCRNGS